MSEKDNNLLDYIPCRNPQISWSYDNDYIVTVDLINKGLFNRIAQKFFGRPRISHIKLEEFGSFIWMQIDGVKSVYDIAQLLKEKFGEKAEPLYDRIAIYMRLLKNNNLIELRK